MWRTLLVDVLAEQRQRRKLGVVAALALLAIVILFWANGLPKGEDLAAIVQKAGPWGPLTVVTLMALAVVASPVPSAPIAVAAGAMYGHWFGTALVAIGAELGAIIAFALARILGRDALRRWFGDRLEAGLLGSQNSMMVAVFLSRLMPFISFDMISYAAGLTPLQPWRFAVSTFAGILPASFVLAHLGGDLAGAGQGGLTLAVLGLGLLTGGPILWVAWHRPHDRVEQNSKSETTQDDGVSE